MLKNRVYCALSYLAAALLVGCACWYFRELLWAVGRKSFFTFHADFLAGFMPWNSETNMYPGQPFSFFDLFPAFFNSFYRAWGAVIVPVFLGLSCAAIFSFLCKRFLLRCKKSNVNEKLWKRLVGYALPLLGALLFLWAQLAFAFSKQSDCKFKDYEFGRVLLKTERLIAEERYDDALQTANAYWFTHPCSIEDVVSGQNSLYASLSEKEIFFRLNLASLTRVALLGAHRLNDDFFTYFRVPEIYGQMDDAGAANGSPLSIYKNQIIGNHTVAYSLIMNLFESEGLSAQMLDLSVFSTLVCNQYALADKYIRLLEHTPFYRRKAQLYKEVALCLQNSSPEKFSTQAQVLAKKIIEERRKIPTDYLHSGSSGEAEVRALWQQNPRSLAALEYLSLLDLLRKNTDGVMAHFDDYLRLSGQEKPPYHLPSSWQELLLIYRTENRPVSQEAQEVVRNLKWDESLFRQSNLFFEARARLRRGEITPYRITQNFGHTFAYNFYYSRFVDAPRETSQNPLEH